MSQTGKYKFFFLNLLKGLGWLLALILLFVYVKNSLDVKSNEVLLHYGNKPLIVYAIYIASEIVMGIIPPEFFMIWSLELAQFRNYWVDVTLLAIISYAAGTITYFFGRYFNTTVIYRYVRKKYLRKYEQLFGQYGGFLVFVAAITPVPYSAICMLVGSVKYPMRKFFLITLSRLLRFAVYGYLVWQASLL
ncbi:MAG: VTT domain-containing protein [Cyclobacteriaceae bacterium]|nr:VTT domain-containing protein [Cyclobacteriaceae bacterium]